MKDYEKRVNKLVRAYMKNLGDSEEKCRKLVLADIEEESIEVVEQNVDEGLLSI